MKKTPEKKIRRDIHNHLEMQKIILGIKGLVIYIFCMGVERLN